MLTPGIQQTQSFQWEDTRTMNARYLLYLPNAYDPDQPNQWPLILFLHGAGQRGSWLWLVKMTGLPRMFWPNFLHRREDVRFIVVSRLLSREERLSCAYEIIDEAISRPSYIYNNWLPKLMAQRL